MYRANNGSFRNSSADLKEATFVTLKNHVIASVRKKRLSPPSKARRVASRNELMEKSGMPDRVESLGLSIDARIVRSRAQLGFVKSVRNGLRRVKNLIESRPSRAETGLARRENGIRLQKDK